MGVFENSWDALPNPFGAHFPKLGACFRILGVSFRKGAKRSTGWVGLKRAGNAASGMGHAEVSENTRGDG